MKLRLASLSDLPQLYVLFKDLTDKMTNDGIKIWNEYYPYDDFENDINLSKLYVIADDKQIFATFTLSNNTVGQEYMTWTEPNTQALYISHLGVNIHHLHKGIGTQALQYIKQIAKRQGIQYLRLLVANINKPAITLYIKNNFKQVEGVFHEESELVGTTIHEFGYELKI